MNLLRFAILILILTSSCILPQKQLINQITVESASWYNWSGGLPGVGGTNYEVVIHLPENSNAEVLNFSVDELNLPFEKPDIQTNLLIIKSIGGSDKPREDVNLEEVLVNHRLENPESASITLLVNKKKIKIPINQFEKITAKKYP